MDRATGDQNHPVNWFPDRETPDGPHVSNTWMIITWGFFQQEGSALAFDDTHDVTPSLVQVLLEPIRALN